MSWSVRHAGSPRSVKGLTPADIIIGLRDGLWEPLDEVMGPQDSKWVAIEMHPQFAAVAAECEPPPPREHPDETRLDMNPLIDVCLVLLVFFILLATYTTLQTVVPLPTKREGQKGDIREVNIGQVQTFMIQVVARPVVDDPHDASIIVEKEAPVGLKQFPTVLRKWVEKTRKQEILLDVSGVSWGMAIKIQDAAKDAGIQKINYLTAQK